MVRTTFRAVQFAIVALGLLALPLITGADPASAAPPPVPTLSSPAFNLGVTANPALVWNPAAGADRYRVQVSAASNFSSLIIDTFTYNTRYTPTFDLPQATIYWRVASVNKAGEQSAYPSGPNTPWQFTKSLANAPDIDPASVTGTVTFPTEPVVLAWKPPAAWTTGGFIPRYYEIEVDDDPGFTPPLAVQTTTYNTSYTLADPQAIGKTYYWRVRARSNDNLPTEFTSTQQYTTAWAVPTNLQTNKPDEGIEEVVFSWDPLAGAVSYDIQVSRDVDFNDRVLDTNVRSTQVSPTVTFPESSYYWRVRGVNSAGGLGNWSTAAQIRREWPPETGQQGPLPKPYDQITLLTPANNSLNVQEPVFSWTPVRLASRYEVQISTDPNFSPGLVSSCTTTHTRVTPYDGCGIDGAPGVAYYWRVRPIDDPYPHTGSASPTFRFQYVPNLVTGLATTGGSGSAPIVLTWNEPVDDIAKYYVVINGINGTNASIGEDTYANRYVPVDLAPGQYSWYVRTRDDLGRAGPVPSPAQWGTFTIAAPTGTGTTPTPQPTTPSNRVPLLKWTPVTGAASYQVWFAPEGSLIYTKLIDRNLRQHAWAHTLADVSPGNYNWYVVALDNNGQPTPGQTFTTGTFSVQALNETVLVGPSNGNCDDNAVPSCLLFDTPTFDWTRVPGATHYLVYLSTNQNFTNIIRTYRTRYTNLTPLESLPDSQAGQATYWYARPCYGVICGPEPSTFAGRTVPPTPVKTFRKQSKPVDVVTDVDGAGVIPPYTCEWGTPTCNDPIELPIVKDQVTFDWTDYLLTNVRSDNPTANPSSVNNTEAKYYRVQVSTTPDFSNIIDTSPTVDQTTFTPYYRTYPEGDLFWRVQAFDGSDNPLTFSPVYALNKRSDPVTLTSPVAQPPAPAPYVPEKGTPRFEWTPQPYARAYEVEVYRDVLTQPLSNSTRVLSLQTRQAAWAPGEVLAPGTYGWRVRRLDTDGLPGPWIGGGLTSTKDNIRKFTITPPAATPTTPANGATLVTDTLRLAWTTVPNATSYRVDISTNSGFTTLTETVQTIMGEYAPVNDYPDGQYYWRVLTLNAAGTVVGTSTTFTFTKDADSLGDFYPMSPFRALDTRKPGFAVLQPGETRNLKVTGVGDVPSSGVSGVVVNVTAVGPSEDSFLTVWPEGISKPPVSNLNYVKGQTVANLVMVKVSGGGYISLQNNKGTTHVLVDITGYFSDGSLPSGSRFQTTASPNRIYDTRSPEPDDPLKPQEARNVTVAGVGGVPGNASAVVMNVTVASSTVPGDLRLWPAGETMPTVSNINYTGPGASIPNLVIVKVGANKQVTVRGSSGSTNVIFDVVGWFEQGTPPPGEAYNPLTPARMWDTRKQGEGPALTERIVRDFKVTEKNGVPANAEAVVLNVTVTQPNKDGFLTIFPSGVARPTASNVNFKAGQSIPNLVTVKVGDGGKISAYAVANTHVILDVVGWYG